VAYLVFDTRWSAESLGNLLKLRCSIGIIWFESYRSISEELSKGAEMSFVKLNRKSQVESTKQRVHSMRRMFIMSMMSTLVLICSLTSATYGNNSVPEGRKLNTL
jgi:hypothetical protein